MDMQRREIPSDREVVEALASFGRLVTALELCDELAKTHPRRDCQLAIQRAVERGLIAVNKGWQLSVASRRHAA